MTALPSFWGPLALSMLAAALLVAASLWRVWRARRQLPPDHGQSHSAQAFALGYTAAALLWLAYGLWTGYRPWLQTSDPAWQMAVHGDSLWSLPLFIGAVAWAAALAVCWALRFMQQAAPRRPRD